MGSASEGVVEGSFSLAACNSNFEKGCEAPA